MIEKLKNWLLSANENGLPIPLIRDNVKGKGSTTLTMYWISFILCILLISGKAADKFGGVSYENTLWLLTITGGMYLGRKIQGGGKNFDIGGDGIKQDQQDPEPKD